MECERGIRCLTSFVHALRRWVTVFPPKMYPRYRGTGLILEQHESEIKAEFKTLFK